MSIKNIVFKTLKTALGFFGSRIAYFVAGAIMVLIGYTVQATVSTVSNGTALTSTLWNAMAADVNNVGKLAGGNATIGYAYAGSMLIQWGTVAWNAGEGVQTITYSTPFSQVYQVTLTPDNNNTGAADIGRDIYAQVNQVTNSSFQAVMNWTGSGGNYINQARWMAIGQK